MHKAAELSMDQDVNTHSTVNCKRDSCFEPRVLHAERIVLTQADIDACRLHLHPLRYPYDPETWLERAQAHVRFGYPELAVSDCWKAILLSQAILSARVADNGARLGYRCGFWMAETEAADSLPTEDRSALERCERLQQLEKSAAGLQQQCLGTGNGVSGLYVPRHYSWLESRHLCRSDLVLDEINRDLQRSCPSDESGRLFCTVRRNALDVEHARDAIGIFANTEIPAGQLILMDESDIWGCKVNAMLARRVEDGDMAMVQWLGLPESEAKEIVSLMRSDGIDDSARTLLKVRCLRRIIQDGVLHPLDHPIIARLKPTYHKQEAAEYYLEDDIVIPNRALMLLGVDIFANQNLDAWVLFTMEARIDNNCFMSSTSACLASLFALFNHSCAPNVQWDSSKSHRCVYVRAQRDIARDEQLFVSYNEYAMDKPVLQRQADLSRWIDGSCKCTRCLIELATALRDQELGCEAAAGGGVPEWNSFAKTVFPEDIVSSNGTG